MSRDWHRLIGWPSAKGGKADDERARRMAMLEQEQAGIKREEKMRGVDVKQQLRLMYGEKAEFRGVQEEALEAIVNAGRRRVLVVAGTGSGKSLLFMLPAAGSEEGLTIVVVPTISLQEDLRVRCEGAGIKCAAWKEGGAVRYNSQIMLVVAESAVTKAFARFIDIKRASHQLERIVIDECHTILESTDVWRPQVRELRNMGGKGTQVVFLTATLPPTDEGRFFEAVGLEASATKVIRESTRRTNVAYRVLEYEKGRLEEALRELVSEKTMEEGEGKVVVYCRTVSETKRMAKVLGCMAYYREVGTEGEKRRIQEELVRGKERVFTATNALGLGIDAPSIRAVVHTGVPFGLRQYGQESGRAGRDGLRSEGIVMRWFKVGRSGEKIVERNARAGEEVKTFMRGDRCRKAVLEEYMDGNLTAVDCQGCVDEVECDVCEGGSGSRAGSAGEVGEVDMVRVTGREEGRLREGKTKRRIDEIEAEEEVLAKRARGGGGMDRWESTERLRRTLQRYAEECAICVTVGKGKEVVREHEWWDCREIGEDEMAKVEGVWEDLGGIVWEEYSSCEGCRVPQAVCNSWQDVDNRERGFYERKSEASCQFRGVMRPGLAALIVIREAEVWEWSRRERGVDIGLTIEDKGITMIPLYLGE